MNYNYRNRLQSLGLLSKNSSVPTNSLEHRDEISFTVCSNTH